MSTQKHFFVSTHVPSKNLWLRIIVKEPQVVEAHEPIDLLTVNSGGIVASSRAKWVSFIEIRRIDITAGVGDQLSSIQYHLHGYHVIVTLAPSSGKAYGSANYENVVTVVSHDIDTPMGKGR